MVQYEMKVVVMKQLFSIIQFVSRSNK